MNASTFFFDNLKKMLDPLERGRKGYKNRADI
jgi:hypothetical protein